MVCIKEPCINNHTDKGDSKDMRIIDMHCDTLWKLTDTGKNGDMMENDCSIDIPTMKKAGTVVQLFACFTDVKDYRNKGGYDAAYRHVHEMMDYLRKQQECYSEDLALAYSWHDVKRNNLAGRISAMMTVEEGGVLNGHMERLEELYQYGIRLMTPMWNYENCIGYPNSRDKTIMYQGLKPFGKEVITRMGELGMIVDVSHASDGTFKDILFLAKGPVVATHSNCRELAEHPRNLTDEMIWDLANTGGIAGLNLYGPFLGTKKESKIEEMTAHILHMLNEGGSEFPAIGTDFDGFDGMIRMEIAHPDELEKLWEALKQKGVSEAQLDKIWYRNAKRVLKGIGV